MDGTNTPIKYRDIKVWIDEYRGDYSSGYTFIKSYSKTVKTSSTGNAEFLFSFPYKGYDRELFRVKIQYYDSNIGDYTYRRQNIHVAWYIIRHLLSIQTILTNNSMHEMVQKK